MIRDFILKSQELAFDETPDYQAFHTLLKNLTAYKQEQLVDQAKPSFLSSLYSLIFRDASRDAWTRFFEQDLRDRLEKKKRKYEEEKRRREEEDRRKKEEEKKR